MASPASAPHLRLAGHRLRRRLRRPARPRRTPPSPIAGRAEPPRPPAAVAQPTAPAPPPTRVAQQQASLAPTARARSAVRVRSSRCTAACKRSAASPGGNHTPNVNVCVLPIASTDAWMTASRLRACRRSRSSEKSRSFYCGGHAPRQRLVRIACRRFGAPDVMRRLNGAALLLVQIVLFQEFGPEILWRSDNVRPTLRREVHQIPIRPHRVDMIRREFGSPEMKDFSIPLPEYMHHRPLHIIGVSLAFVIGLVGRVRSGNQRDLRPSTSFGPRIDPIGRGFGNCDKRGVSSDLIPASIKPIDQRRTRRTGIVPARTVHE